MVADTSADFRLRRLAFADLAGWDDDDHSTAWSAFRRSAAVAGEHPPRQRGPGIDARALAGVLATAGRAPDALTREQARAFFEAAFVPHEVIPASGRAFFTGYYEPEVAGSVVETPAFTVPIYRPPDDLVEVDPGDPPPGLDPGFRFARRTADGLREHPDRAAIAAGALAGRGLELVWLADAVDAFFIHVQGSARVRLADGRVLRLTYAARTGHPYTPIGRVLVEAGALARHDVTMRTIRAWLAGHPAEAGPVMAQNRSYVFFREAPVGDPELGPVAAAKTPLTPMRSLAVDRTLMSFHTPVWIETALPDGAPLRRLTIAQDTGSAIVGPGRGDVFFGSGEAAGEIAGAMKADGRFVVLVPREAAG
jgi:membrane-bound lytic murein transglycosylase A